MVIKGTMDQVDWQVDSPSFGQAFLMFPMANHNLMHHNGNDDQPRSFHSRSSMFY